MVHCFALDSDEAYYKNANGNQNIPVVDFIAEARREADRIRKEAEEIAQKILRDAENDAAAVLSAVRENGFQEGRRSGFEEGFAAGAQEGFQKGYMEGKAKGEQDAQEEIKRLQTEAIAKAAALIAEAEKEHRQILLDAELQIIELVMAIVKKILGRQLDEDPQTVVSLVKNILTKVVDTGQVTVRVHPLDYEVVLKARRDLALSLGREQILSITADETVGRGGCIVNTAMGTVEAQLDDQCEIIKNVLRDVAVAG